MEASLSKKLLGFRPGDFELSEKVPGPVSAHIHGDIEISTFKHSAVTMLYTGGAVTVPPGHLIVHWGILPHQTLSREPDARVMGLHLPLAWFLQWDLPRTFVNRILNLEVLIDDPRQSPCSDLALFQDWIKVVNNSGKEGMEIVLLEMRSRLWRMAIDLNKDSSPSPVATKQPVMLPAAFERAIEYIAEHYLEAIRIPEIAKAAGVSRTHVMRLFRQTTGGTINGYITHLRLSHAQCLLVTTNQKVIDIMFESGFTSANHFYKVFKRYTHTTPARYRREIAS